MSTDTPNEASEVSIESRMAAVFGAEEAESPEVAPVEATPETDDDAAPEVAEADEIEDVFEFEADDGSTLKLPAAAKEAVLRQKDYTQKTMQLADMQRQAQDRLQFIEAREQFSAAVFEDVTQLRTLETQLKQYQEADWASLYDSSPGQALRLQQSMRDLEKQVSQKTQDINAKAQHIQQATSKHREFQWQAAEKGARQLIGEVSTAENVAMLTTIQTLGITPQEYKEKFADPRIIALTHKAAKWDALQGAKPSAIQKANQAPPVVKPGASKGPSVSAEQTYRDTRAKLGKTGSVADAAKLFLLRGM